MSLFRYVVRDFVMLSCLSFVHSLFLYVCRSLFLSAVIYGVLFLYFFHVFSYVLISLCGYLCMSLFRVWFNVFMYLCM